METIMLVGFGVFAILAAANAFYAWHNSRALEQHLRSHHYQQWQRIYHDRQWVKALFWPMLRDTPVEFGWRSLETFGDSQIGTLRARIKKGMLGFAVASIAAVAWFAVIALWLEFGAS